MKKVILVIALVAILAVSIGLAYVFAIAPELKLASVTGTYTNPASDATVKVNRDGTVFIQSEGESTGVQGTWKFVDDNTLQVSFTLLGTPNTTQYYFDGNQLTNTANNGNILAKNGSINSNPTSNPTQQPTSAPTDSPTAIVTAQPTANPSQTDNPTTQPTVRPTSTPTSTPTATPTTTPTPTA